LRNSVVVVGILTASALNSREVKSEWNYAIDGKARLILLRYEPIELPYWLRGIQYIDCVDDENLGLTQLLAALNERPVINQTAFVPNPDLEPKQGLPAYVSPFLPDKKMAYQRRRIASWALLVGLTFTFVSLFSDERTLTLISIALSSIPAFVALMPDTQMPNTKILKSLNPIRAAILENVYQAWIEGVLRPNLPTGVLDLELGLRPGAVLRHIDYGDYVLPNSSGEIARIFTEMRGELLILGAPGSGKTIFLLQLAEQLLGRAQHDPQAPLPLVFNLASWRQGQAFEAWLVAEMQRNYGVPKKTATELVTLGKLALLLDGLDELMVNDDMMPGADATELDSEAMKLRSACIQAINIYRKAHPDLLEIAVCSRIKDYEALGVQFDLNAAILLNALNDEQIQTYLVGDEHTGTRELLAHEPSARQLAESPLLLTIMKQSYLGRPYTGSPFEQLKLKDDQPNARRQHLFEAYLRQQLRTASDVPYTSQQTRHYLGWLAQQMVRHQQTVFTIEELQPSWVSDNQRYRRIVMLSVVLCGLLIGFLFISKSRDILYPILQAQFFGFIGVMVFNFYRDISKIKMVDKILFLFPKNIFIWGVITLLLSGLIIYISDGEFIVLVSFSLIGLFILIMIGGIVPLAQPTLRQSSGSGLQDTLKNTMFYLLYFVFGSLITFSLIGSLAGVLSENTIEGLIFGLNYGLIFGMFLGLFFATLIAGGSELIKHVVLRLELMREGVIPRRPHWRYDRFLDHCAALGLLRKVGGGYIFRHRLLLEHLAQAYKPNPPPPPTA
jgi:hypothetical protein